MAGTAVNGLETLTINSGSVNDLREKISCISDVQVTYGGAIEGGEQTTTSFSYNASKWDGDYLLITFLGNTVYSTFGFNQ